VLGWTVSESPLLHISYSPLGVVPTRTPGEFCLIHYLSYLKGLSVNDGIDNTSISYATIADAIRHIRIAGRGYFLAKTDVKEMLFGLFLFIPKIIVCLV